MPKINIKTLPYYREYLAIFIVNIVLMIVFFILQNNLPLEIPLYYGFPKGIEQLAPRIAILLPPAVCLLISIVNQAISFIVENDFGKKILLVTSVVITILSTMTTIKIFLLVGSF